MPKLKVFTILFDLALIAVCLLPVPKSAPTPFTRTDLVVHLVSYLLVTMLALRSFSSKGKVLTILLIQGIAIEIIQPYVNRHFEWLDIGANSLGVLLAFLAYHTFMGHNDRTS